MEVLSCFGFRPGFFSRGGAFCRDGTRGGSAEVELPAEMAPGVDQFGASGPELPDFGRTPCPGSRGELGATSMARGWHVRVLSLI